MRNQYQISLRAIFLAILAVGIVLGVWRSESVGRLGLESDTWEMSSGFSHGQLIFTCKSNGEAEKLTTDINQGRLLVFAESVIREKCPQAARSVIEATIQAEGDGRVVRVYYLWHRWGRWRLEIMRMKYVFDRDDPVARSRNVSVYESFQEAARQMAIQSKSIEEWHKDE